MKSECEGINWWLWNFEYYIIKHQLDNSTCGKLIGNLEEGQQIQTDVVEEFKIAHSVISVFEYHSKQVTVYQAQVGMLSLQYMAANFRYIVVTVKRNRISAVRMADQLRSSTDTHIFHKIVSRRLR